MLDNEINLSDNIKRCADKQRRRNELIYVLRHISQTTSTRLTVGSFATSFMLFMGMNTQDISVVTFATNAGLFAASILVIFAYNKDKSGLGIIKLGSLGNAMIPVGMLIASFVYTRSLVVAIFLLMLTSFIGNTAYSMRNSAEINAVPILFGRDRYTYLMGKCGYLGGSVTLVVSLITIFLIDTSADIEYFRIFFSISSGLMIAYAILSLFFVRPVDQKNIRTPYIDFKKIFTKKYLIAALPHLTRGVGAAALALWPATIMSGLDMSPFFSTLLIPMTIFAEIIGSIFFVRVSTKIRPGTITMISFFASATFMFLTPVIKTVPIFFVCYFIYDFMLNGFGKALTASFVYSCSGEELPLISSLHVLYYAIAYCPAVLLFGKFMDSHTFLCMLIAGSVYIISGIMFHYFFYKPAKR